MCVCVFFLWFCFGGACTFSPQDDASEMLLEHGLEVSPRPGFRVWGIAFRVSGFQGFRV